MLSGDAQLSLQTPSTDFVNRFVAREGRKQLTSREAQGNDQGECFAPESADKEWLIEGSLIGGGEGRPVAHVEFSREA